MKKEKNWSWKIKFGNCCYGNSGQQKKGDLSSQVKDEKEGKKKRRKCEISVREYVRYLCNLWLLFPFPFSFYLSMIHQLDEVKKNCVISCYESSLNNDVDVIQRLQLYRRQQLSPVRLFIITVSEKKKKTIYSFYCFIFYPQVNRRVCLIVVVCCSPLLLIPKKNFNTSQRLTKHPISVAHLYLELMTSPSLNHYKMFRFNLFFFPVFHLQF